MLRRVLELAQAFQNIPEGLSATWFMDVAPQLLSLSKHIPHPLHPAAAVFPTDKVLLSKGNPQTTCIYARLHCSVFFFHCSEAPFVTSMPLAAPLAALPAYKYIKPCQSNARALADPSTSPSKTPRLHKTFQRKHSTGTHNRKGTSIHTGNWIKPRQRLLRTPLGLPAPV